jgi:ATP-dependent RNA/DNA helicase IGHMBP2
MRGLLHFFADIPLVLIDTTGCDMFEVATEDEQSKANEGEAALVAIHAKQLIDSGVDPAEIAVITPYNLQVELIRLQLRDQYPQLEVRSVDGFQGREKEAVILSLVRSNPSGEVGFLAESRRLNVAITRAKRHVAIIANVETVSHNAVLKGLAEHLEAKGEVRSAMQYEHLVQKVDISRPEGLQLTLKDTIEVPSKTKKAKAAAARKKASTKKVVESAKIKKGGHVHQLENKLELTEDNESKEALNVRRRKELEAIVRQFEAEAGAETYNFPSELNSFDRMVVHEIAEVAGLGHESKGEGKTRYIVLTKKAGKKIKAKPTAAVMAPEAKTDSTVVICSNCSKELPKANIDLHKLKCVLNLSEVPKANGVKSKKAKQSKKKKKAEEEEEDIDRLLASFDKIDNVCNAEGCKTKLVTLATQCDFCRLRFCIGHGLPEVHGCGDAAKVYARRQLANDGKLYPGSGRPNFKPDPAKKAQMQRKLDKKLADLEDVRKAKPPPSKK